MKRTEPPDPRPYKPQQILNMRYHDISRMAQTKNRDSVRMLGKWISSALLSWVFIGGTDVEDETPILWAPDVESWLIWKDPDAGKDWGQEEKVEGRGWDGWMASPTQCTWVWVNSGSWWWTGRPGVLRFMGSQRVRHDWVTELNWTYTLGIKITD